MLYPAELRALLCQSFRERQRGLEVAQDITFQRSASQSRRLSKALLKSRQG
jgi:hypothetical protein